MHETDMTKALILTVKDWWESQPERPDIAKVHLIVGQFTCVEPASLQFSFEVQTRHTFLEGAELVIQETPLIAYCHSCQQEYRPEIGLHYGCPQCQAPMENIRSGRELKIDRIECVQGVGVSEKRQKGLKSQSPAKHSMFVSLSLCLHFICCSSWVRVMHQTFDVALGVNLLHANQEGADHNRTHLDEWGITCLNVMSSPGAGKTVLLERTLAALQSDLRMAVIEGDMTTELDADRLRHYGVPVIAINTGRSCHLDSKMVAGGLHRLAQDYNPTDFDLLLVENVGNLVCPAEFEVGEHAKVALLSITEGEDKPLKYPIMFQEAHCLLITKMDLAPYLDVEVNRIIANVRQMNPQATIIPVSAKTGEGLAQWFEWVRTQVTQSQRSQPSRLASVPAALS